MKLYYAQNKEDLFIRGFFPEVKDGFYIDIGANDPVIDSVTKSFYDDGWHGINIEPIHKHIIDLNKQRPRDINLEVGVGNKNGEKLFKEYPQGDGLSTFAKPIKDFYKQSHNFPTLENKDYIVPIKTLEYILKKYKVKHVHFIKIDVEGYEYEVLTGYDWKEVRPELICIEVNHILKDWRPFIEAKNYKLVFYDGINNYYLAKEAIYRKQYFQYPDIALANNPIYYPTYKIVFKKTKKEIKEELYLREKLLTSNLKEKEQEILYLTSNLKEKEQEILYLTSNQRDIKFLAKRLHSEIFIRLNRRSSSYKPAKSLSYRSDPEIDRIIEDKSLSSNKVLDMVHQRDKINVCVKNNKISSYTRVWFWKIALHCYSLATKIIKRIFSYV